MRIPDFGMKIKDVLCLFAESREVVPDIDDVLQVSAAVLSVDLASAESACYCLSVLVLHLLGKGNATWPAIAVQFKVCGNSVFDHEYCGEVLDILCFGYCTCYISGNLIACCLVGTLSAVSWNLAMFCGLVASPSKSHVIGDFLADISTSLSLHVVIDLLAVVIDCIGYDMTMRIVGPKVTGNQILCIVVSHLLEILPYGFRHYLIGEVDGVIGVPADCKVFDRL